MRIIDSRADYLSRYLTTTTAKTLASWDEQPEESLPTDIDVYCMLGWRDVTRALSATQLVERELRRGAKAYRDAFGPSSGHDILATSPSELLKKLAEAPSPLHTNVSGLDMIEVAGAPLALRLKPTEDTMAALAVAGCSLVGFTMAGFGRGFTIERLTGRNHRPDDFDLANVTKFIERGRPAFEVTSEIGFKVQDLEKTYYQTVSSPPQGEGFGFEVHLVVQRKRGSQIDLIHGWN